MNDGKTQAIIFPFNRRRVRAPTIPLRIEQRTIELSDSVNYLGVFFDKMLLFNRHITNAINKTNKCFRALYPLMAAKSKLSLSHILGSTSTNNVVRQPSVELGCNYSSK